jgi:glycosyltransferase involved in cell wall biosynthesis
MPSLSEGFPVTGVQASALGLALVVSHAGGFPEIVIQGENGFVTDAYDTPAMHAALHVLLVDPHKLLNVRLRSRELASRYNLDLIVKEYLQIFHEVAA